MWLLKKASIIKEIMNKVDALQACEFPSKYEVKNTKKALFLRKMN